MAISTLLSFATGDPFLLVLAHIVQFRGFVLLPAASTMRAAMGILLPMTTSNAMANLHPP
jgi:Na+-translocating ferredoxin:NAD+ oxidoreductase RnfA subunit